MNSTGVRESLLGNYEEIVHETNKRAHPTINGGSLSIKFVLYEAGKTPERWLYGTVDRIGLSGTNLPFCQCRRDIAAVSRRKNAAGV